MKVLSTEQQVELLELLTKLNTAFSSSLLDHETMNQIEYWVIELKPKRIRKKKYLGLDLNTEEGVIEQAYQEHTGNV